MPRKAFVADLSKAVESVSIAGISDVQTGNDDGEFTFTCVADGQQLKISVLIPGMFSSISATIVLCRSSHNLQQAGHPLCS